MITRPCYCSRDDAMRSIDSKDTVITIAQYDRALAAAADNIDQQMHRFFYPVDGTRYFDWPTWVPFSPWRLWLGRHDLVALTQFQSPGTGTPVTIPLNQIFLEPVNRRRGFPYTHIELDRSTSAKFSAGLTPQHSIYATGTWGFTADADLAGTITANINASVTTIAVSDGSQCGAGDVLILGYARGAVPFPASLGTAGAVAPYAGERVIVQDKTTVTTALTVSGTGCNTAVTTDNLLTPSGAGLNAGEVLLIGQERMLIKELLPSGVCITERAWDGTQLGAHANGDTIYAYRNLVVVRGELGTTAAAWSMPTSVFRHRPPQLIRDLNIAETVNQVLQETSGHSRTVSAGDAAMPAPGIALADKWDEAQTAFGRKVRVGAI